MKRFLLTSIIPFFVLLAYSQQVTYNQAKERALLFFRTIENRENNLKAAALVAVDSFRTFSIARSSLFKSAGSSDEPAFYIFNRKDKPGFVIVSAEEKIRKIIAWSTEATICEIHPGLKSLLNQYVQEIALAKSLEITSPEVNESERSVVEALLGKIEWSQAPLPYNALCPVDPETGGKCPAGCVATAMAQIIYYHRYPRAGTGSKTYKDGIYSLSVNFAEATYDYDAMNEQPAYNVANDEIAKLLYHCGVSVETDYGPFGSSAFEGSAALALNKHFKYKPPTVRYHSSYSPAGWKQMIANELNSKRPVLYGALDPLEPGNPEDVGAGHAFVLDGINDQDQYHLNFGWGGCSNGYYSLSLLNPTSCGSRYLFSDLHMMVTGIEPIASEECLLSVNDNYLECPDSGGNLSVNISSTSTWRIIENEEWLLVPVLTGTGNRILTFTVLPNEGYDEREGKMILEGCGDSIAVHVVQKGSCSVVLSADSLRFPISGGRKKIGIKATSSWLILSNVDWIYITPAMGSGSDSLRINVTNNTGFSQRKGIITLYGCNTSLKIPVSQDGSCSLELSKDSAKFDPAGGKDSVTVLSGVPWAVKCDVPWISITPLTSEGNGNISFTVQPNADFDVRTGAITVSGCNADKVISIVQDGVCFIDIASNKVEFGPEADDKFILVTSNSQWVAVSETCWISASPLNGQDTAYLGITVAANLGQSQRSGYVTVSGCGSVKRITVIQQSYCPLELSTTAVDFAYMPGNKSVTVASTSAWSVTSETPWISVTPQTGSQNGKFLISVQENITGEKRSGMVTVSGCFEVISVSVTQEACKFSVPDQGIIFFHEAGTKTLDILSTSVWTASGNAKWLTVTPMYGTQSGSITLNAEANIMGKREAVLTLRGCYSMKEIRIIQEGNPTPVSTFPSRQFKIFPSLTNRYVQIEFPGELTNCKIAVYNSSGQEIILRNQISSFEKIDLEGFSDGIYYLRVFKTSLIGSERIMLNHNL